MRGDVGAEDAGDVHDRCRLLGIEEPPGIAEAMLLVVRVVGVDPAQLALVGGEVDGTALWNPQSMPASATTAPTSSTARCISRAIASTARNRGPSRRHRRDRR